MASMLVKVFGEMKTSMKSENDRSRFHKLENLDQDQPIETQHGSLGGQFEYGYYAYNTTAFE